MEIMAASFDLEKVISGICGKTEDERVELFVDIAPDVPSRVTGDRALLRRILENLLDNAAARRTPGRVVLRVDTPPGGAGEDGVLLRFIVEDTAAGELRGDGCGMGLAIPLTKQLAELMGGDITVENQAHGGTKVTVLLPFRRSRGAPARLEDIKAGAYPQFRGAKVLLCEDDDLNREMAGAMLGAFGIVPALAENGREALELLARETFHMVFMDIVMPVMNGYEAASAIRRSAEPYAEIPIVALSADVTQNDAGRCLREGMNAHLGKPMDIRQVYESLLRYLPSEITGHSAPLAEGVPGTMRLPVIEGVDAAAGAARFAGDAGRYMKALARFAATLGSSLLPWQEAATPGHRAYTRRAIHTLKGASGNLGVVNLYEEAAAFERAFSEDGESGESAKRYGRLAKSCRDTGERIRAALPAPGNGKTARSPGSDEGLRSLVLRMEEAFESSRLELCNTLMKEAEETEWAMDAERLSAVTRAIDEYDFEEAGRLLGVREESA